MRTMTLVALAAIGAGLVRPAAGADDEPGEVRMLQASPQPPDRTPRTGTSRSSAPRRGDSANSGVLKGSRLRSSASGEAEVQLADGTLRTLRPGDKAGSDTVETIEPGRIVLRRAAAGGAPTAGLVVVTFEASGVARVRVYLDADPTALPVREVR